MSNFITWWKNHFGLLIAITAVLTVVIAFLFAYFISWGWIVSILIAFAGGFAIMKLIVKYLTEYRK